LILTTPDYLSYVWLSTIRSCGRHWNAFLLVNHVDRARDSPTPIYFPFYSLSLIVLKSLLPEFEQPSCPLSREAPYS